MHANLFGTPISVSDQVEVERLLRSTGDKRLTWELLFRVTWMIQMFNSPTTDYSKWYGRIYCRDIQPFLLDHKSEWNNGQYLITLMWVPSWYTWPLLLQMNISSTKAQKEVWIDEILLKTALPQGLVSTYYFMRNGLLAWTIEFNWACRTSYVAGGVRRQESVLQRYLTDSQGW